MASPMKTALILLVVAIAATHAAPAKNTAAKQAAVRASSPTQFGFDSTPSTGSRRDGLFNDSSTTVGVLPVFDGVVFGDFASDEVCNFVGDLAIADAVPNGLDENFAPLVAATTMRAPADYCPDQKYIDGKVKVHIHGHHTHTSDLLFRLVRGETCERVFRVDQPGPDFVDLVIKAGGENDDFNFVVWEDAADVAPTSLDGSSANLGAEGSMRVFKPMSPSIGKLDLLQGKQCCKDWSVHVLDTQLLNVGTFVHWSLHLPGCSHGDIE